MTLYDFLRLNQAERADQVHQHGVFLASQKGRGNLYNMGEFFAELVYDQDKNEIQEVRGFKTLRNLEPYLNGIDINLDDSTTP